MEFKELLEFSKSVDTVWGFLTFFVLAIIFIFIYLYKKDKLIFNKIIDRFTGKKNNLQLDKITKQLSILNHENLNIKENSKVKRELFLSEIKLIVVEIEKINTTAIANYEKNKLQHKDLFFKMDKLSSNQKYNIYKDGHNKMLVDCYYNIIHLNSQNPQYQLNL